MVASLPSPGSRHAGGGWQRPPGRPTMAASLPASHIKVGGAIRAGGGGEKGGGRPAKCLHYTKVLQRAG